MSATKIKVIMLILMFVVIIILILRKMKILMPVPGSITSKYGYRIHPITKEKKFHNGIDIAAPSGTPVKSPLSGEILKIWSDTAGGNSLHVKHADGYTTGYAHLSKYGNFKVGDKVAQGDVIAYVGSTGQSTGPHLHFVVRKNGNLIDPQTLL